MKKILLINDMAGYGKVATAAMLPVLSYMGHPTYILPTALVSNTLDYGKFSILETTDYIKSVLPVWRELGFGFDAVATGFMVSDLQAKVVASYCRELAAGGAEVFADPIMGDEGWLYNGVTADRVECMRTMASVAGLIFPNHTEACLLTDTPYDAAGMTWDEARRMVDKLRRLGTRSVLVTSIPVEGQPSVVGFNADDGDYFRLSYTEIPVHFPGTGDLFSAILIGHRLNGMDLKTATRLAMDAVYRLIDINRDNRDKNMGIPVERYLSEAAAVYAPSDNIINAREDER